MAEEKKENNGLKWKTCFNHCPKCNATDPDIEWGDKEWNGTGAWQDATCKKCGCGILQLHFGHLVLEHCL